MSQREGVLPQGRVSIGVAQTRHIFSGAEVASVYMQLALPYALLAYPPASRCKSVLLLRLAHATVC